MTNKEIVNQPEETEIDLAQIFRALLHRLWLLILAVVLFAVAGFVVTWLFITPKYSTTFTSYVNNHNSADALTSLTSSDMSARSTLANTTAKIASSTMVLNQVCERTMVDPDDIQVTTNVDTTSGILTVRVVMADKTKVLPVANTLALVLTEETSRIIEGSSLQIVDIPQEPDGKYSPSFSRNVVVAALIGLILAAIIVIILELTDDTLKDASELESQYGIPIVGAIPDMSAPVKKGGYAKYGYGYGYGYGYDYASSSSRADSRMKAPGVANLSSDKGKKSEKSERADRVKRLYEDQDQD